MHAGGPFTDKEALEKSSSDGFVKEVLIWQHRALMLPSPSPGSPMSISGRSRTWIQSWEASRAPEEERGRNERRDGRKQDSKYCLFIFRTDPVSIKGEKMERVTLMASPLNQKARTQDEADISATTQHSWRLTLHSCLYIFSL